ncbi:MAG: dienelactone hydrolase family protein [Cyanobacteria bacterium RU_5_0]|nr:dienelactone hydrolase family protein [Cyanobacteria bacterium RU_5_0]
MRKWFGLALIGFLLVTLWTMIDSRHQVSPAQTYSQQMMLSHIHDTPVASQMVAQAPSVEVMGDRVTYATVDGTPVTGYLARPADATEPLPGLIVIHEWWGLNDNIEAMTRRLAGEGYVALAVDLFNAQVAQNPDQARAQVQAATANSELLNENLRQAYQYLETEQQAPRIASIGWCFGGSWSLNTALLLPDQLDATVIYYGGQLVTEPEQLSPLQMPILGIFGSLDDNPSPETVQQFESALNSLGKSAEIYIYEGADHAFANPSGTRYDAEAAEDAWQRTIAFLEQHLKA